MTQHIFTSMIGFVTWPPFFIPINYYKRWPSDKANHTCENTYAMSFKELQIFDKVTSWPQLISNLLVCLPVCNVASDWPRTFLHPRCFCLVYVYILTQSSDMFTKSSDMLNKNTLGVKTL